MSLQTLTALSRRYGKNPAYVLAGGGNTSFKDTQYLFVKASGRALADIDEEGFVKLSRARLNSIFQRVYDENPDRREAQVLADMLDARCAGEEHKRPSVEALLHNLMPEPYVLHLHPTMVGGLVCGREGRAAFDRLFAREGVWIPPTMPGYILSAAVRDALRVFEAAQGQPPVYVFLENHGVFVGGESPEELDRRWQALTDTLDGAIGQRPVMAPADYDAGFAALVAPALRALAGGAVTFAADGDIQAAVADPESFARVHTDFSPDHLVYCGPRAYFLDCESPAEAHAQLAALGKLPLPCVVGLRGQGIFAAGGGKREADNAAALFGDAARLEIYARSFGGGKPLPEALSRAIAGWEVERYRRGVAAGNRAAGRLAGKIALVTGAAQGFGLGIAGALAAEGAYVAVADINLAGARDAAQALCAQYGPGMALAVGVDVGSEDSVRDMAYQTALAYGGIDLFVSNAGILKAGGLEELSLTDFERVTKINYTAFFLGVKYAARLMKLQRRFDPAATFDIIQINSKSGLAGSNRNFAYAGGKFGGIGLVQSFALELVGDGIKVNAVCPGNFFDGPLWMDPEKGLFAQYLRAGKVPGAKTTEDVKRFYEEKVPMGRGCEVPDVARAILYLVEQQYETGQALPVTGGQVMLR